MNNALPIRRFAMVMALAMAAGIHARAQYPNNNDERPRWHATGFAGFDLAHTSQEQANGEGQSNQLFPLGDMRLNSDGFLLDPRFLVLNTALDYQKGVNSSNVGDLSTGGMNLAVSTSFLPKSHFPLRVSYDRTNHGVSGLGLNQNDDGSRLDVQWNVLSPRLPHLTLAFQKYSNTVHVPASFADHNYDETAFSAGASDSWKDWRWAGNFSQGYGNSTGTASVLGLDSTFKNSTRAAGFNLSRNFMENKARLIFENREVWGHDNLSGDGNNRSSEFTNNLNFDVQVTPHVTLAAGYGYAKVDFSGESFNGVLGPGGAPVQVLSLSSSTSNAFTSRVDYRPWDWLRLSQDVRSVLNTPLSSALESRTFYTDTGSTIAAEHRWRNLDMMGSYTGTFQLTGTTLDHTPDSWSNSFTGRLGWGNVKRVHLTALAQNTRLNLVEQIGGFTDEKRVGMEAETHFLKNYRFRVSGEYSEIDLLNLSGDTRSKNVLYSAQAEHRRFSLWFTLSFLDGAGALFPDGLIDRQFLVVPLPVNQLLATPLLNRTTNTRSAGLVGRLRRNLDLLLTWRSENVKLTTSQQEFNVLQGDARYRLGKFSLEGGYSRNLNDVTNITGLSGTRLAVWYFRIGRDFRIF
jgi:hypothetical protein